MAYSQMLEQYGNPAEQSAQRMQKRNSINRLMELEHTRVQRADADAAMGPGRTSVTGARDYFQRLNDEGEMAGIQNTLAGRKPQVSHSYGGTDFAEGPRPMPQQRRASVDALESDNLDYYDRLASVEGRQIQNERQRNAEFDESTADDPHFAARRRATRHAGIVDEGAARGEADASAYLAPGQNDARRQKRWDDESYAEAVGPYSPAAIRGQTEMNKQREISDRESQKALIGADARRDTQAVRSYGSVAAAEANNGRDVSEARGDLRSRLPGGPGGGDRVVTPEQMNQIAAQRGLDPEAVRRFFQSKGYTVQGDVPVR